VVQRSPVLTSGDLITVWGTGFRISGVTLDGNHVTNFTEELGLLGANPIIDSIEIKNNANIGVAVATSGAKILNSHIVGLASPTVGSMGIWFDSSQVERLLIAHNVIQNQRLNGIFGSGRAVEITRNYLSGNHRQVFPSGGGQIAIKGVPTNANISIVGNVIENGGGAVTSGIEIDGPPVQVIWNTVRWNALLGIILQSGFGHQVVGNAVSNSGSIFAKQPGILVVAGISGFRILGNRAFDDQTDKTQSHGIQVETGPSSDYVIAGNDVRGNALPSGISDEGWGPNRLVFGNIDGP